MAFHCEWQRKQVKKWEEAQNAKNRILTELETLYERLEGNISDATRRIYQRKVAILEKMFEAYDNNGDCTVEDLL